MRWIVVMVLAGLFFSPAISGRAALGARQIYYEPTIREIINRDCARCHSGPLRNLMSYNAVKAYADNGMLAGMVQSLMSTFAGADADTIMAWIDMGAPRQAKPTTSNQAAPAGFASAIPAAAGGVYYEPDIRDIIGNDCSPCHSGGARNLMDWDNVRAYVDSGMLAAMLQGPMAQYAGSDAGVILNWIDAGAPENPPRAGAGPAPIAFGRPCPSPGGGPGGLGGPGGQGYPPQANITYADPIEGLLAKDCLRCHLGPFRKMTTYGEVRMYVDNGLLEALVRPGGQMHRFAGPDARLFLAWIRAGAPG